MNTSSIYEVDLSILIGEKKPVPSGAWTCSFSIAGQYFNQQATSTRYGFMWKHSTYYTYS